MEYLILAIVIIVLVLMLKFIFKFNIKEIKEIGVNKKLDELTKKFPENTEICKWYLKKLNNTTTKIQENLESKNSMYIAITDKIIIANIKESYTRIQTIAHECLHSIQNKKLLIFNFIFSNIYLLYFFIISVLTIFGNLQNQMAHVATLAVMGIVYLTVRLYLESDAMIKARYLAKEYMNKKKISSEEEIQKMIKQYDVVTNFGVKCVYYQLGLNVLSKIAILSLLCFWK